MPFAFAWARLVAYMLSRKSVDSVALMNANFLPAPATFAQSIVFCQWLTSMPSRYELVGGGVGVGVGAGSVDGDGFGVGVGVGVGLGVEAGASVVTFVN